MDKTIFLIHHACNLRSMACDALSSRGYKVIAAPDASAALQEMKDGARPDLIIICLSIPGMDGSPAIRRMRACPDLKTTPVLVVALEEMLDRQMEWKAAGATAWVTHPFTPDSFVKMAEMVMF
ncbi:MAG: response regulator [Deltaproteobacteria bacterium]|nr:response regulator [Deltaproteobacteria bacterium]